MKTIKYLHFIFLVMIFLIMSSCSNKIGTTNSKIRILSGNLFGLLSDQANNGLVLYGHNNKGKTFLKIISEDIVDLNLPNGVWNFYAIGWGFTTPSADSRFKGTTICSKTLAVQLSGADIALSMTLSNANCDTDFHPDVDTIGSEKKLSSFQINTCRNFASVIDASSGAQCSSTPATANKGFATYVKIVMPEYSHLGQATDGFSGADIQSRCIEIDSTSASSGALLNAEESFNLPMPGKNGMALSIKAYYTSVACDDAVAPSLFPLEEGMISPKIKRFPDHNSVGYQAIDHYFIQTEAVDVCQPPRLSISGFASGRGTAYLPYTICNPEQLRLMRTNFTTISTNHFELLKNLNFGFFNDFKPIGDDTTTVASTVTPFTGSFNGNGLRIENMRINCKSLFSTPLPLLGGSVGLFRYTKNATIKNLTLNKIVIDCGNENSISPQEVNNVGMIVGKSVDTTFLNVKAFGYVSGSESVGGITGNFSGPIASMNDVHVEATIQGKRYVGGILGRGLNIGSSTNNIVLQKSSFKGDVHARLQSHYLDILTTAPTSGTLGDYYSMPSTSSTNVPGRNYYYDPFSSNTTSAWKLLNSGNTGYSQVPYDTFMGGLAGELTSTPANHARVSEIKIDLNLIEGSRLIGGLIGKTYGVDIDNSYVTGLIKSYSQLDGTDAGTGFSKIGGLVGSAANGNINHNLVIVDKVVETQTRDATLNGVIGYEISTLTCASNLFKGVGVTASTCNSSAMNLNSLLNPESYSDFAYDTSNSASANTIWSWPTSDYAFDYPRLTWELSKQNEVPYLKRLCSTFYANGTGTGLTPKDPLSVCSWDQLFSMSTSLYYELKKNLIYDNPTALSPIRAGVYHLNGNNFSLSNLLIDSTIPNNALFETLAAGSEIRNLKIDLAKVTNPVSPLPPSTSNFYNVAILAANNAGTIENIEISNSRINLKSLILTSSQKASIGGIVANNLPTGIIRNIDNDVEVILDLPTVPSTASLKAGGLVASNEGTISIIRQEGMVSRRIGNYGGETQSLTLPSTCSNAEAGHYVNNIPSAGVITLDSGYYRCNGSTWISVSANLMSDAEEIGGLVAYNNGVIQEVEQQNSIQIMDSITNIYGKLSPFISRTGSNSRLQDISFRGNLNSNKASISNFFTLFDGTINRMIVNLGRMNSADFTATNSIIPATGVSKMICVQGGSSMLDCQQPGPITYEYTAANGLSFLNNRIPISEFSYLTNWNIGTGFLPDMTKTWKLENGELSLMRTGGSFEKIGAGF